MSHTTSSCPAHPMYLIGDKSGEEIGHCISLRKSVKTLATWPGIVMLVHGDVIPAIKARQNDWVKNLLDVCHRPVRVPSTTSMQGCRTIAPDSHGTASNDDASSKLHFDSPWACYKNVSWALKLPSGACSDVSKFPKSPWKSFPVWLLAVLMQFHAVRFCAVHLVLHRCA